MKYLLALGFLGVASAHSIIGSQSGYNGAGLFTLSSALETNACTDPDAPACVEPCADACFSRYFQQNSIELDSVGVVINNSDRKCYCTTTLIAPGVTPTSTSGFTQTDVSKTEVIIENEETTDDEETTTVDDTSVQTETGFIIGDSQSGYNSAGLFTLGSALETNACTDPDAPACVEPCADACFSRYFQQNSIELDSVGVVINNSDRKCYCTTTLIAPGVAPTSTSGFTQTDVSKPAPPPAGSFNTDCANLADTSECTTVVGTVTATCDQISLSICASLPECRENEGVCEPADPATGKTCNDAGLSCANLEDNAFSIDCSTSSTFSGCVNDKKAQFTAACCTGDITDCKDTTACNANPDADIADDSLCNYPQQNYNCEGVCIANIDCNGVCGGSATTDTCGVCDADSSNDNQPTSDNHFCEDGQQKQKQACSTSQFISDSGDNLNDRTCTKKQCECTHGIGTDGTSCSENGASECASCTGDFYLSNKQCLAWTNCPSDKYETAHPSNTQNRACDTKVCTCEGGVGAQGDDCPEHDTEKCTECTGSNLVLHDHRCKSDMDNDGTHDDADEDTDGDGVTDVREEADGTDPLVDTDFKECSRLEEAGVAQDYINAQCCKCE